jgi:hypothetical protein
LADLKRYSAARKIAAGFPSQCEDGEAIYSAEQACTGLAATVLGRSGRASIKHGTALCASFSIGG